MVTPRSLLLAPIRATGKLCSRVAAAFDRALPDLLILAGVAGIWVGLWWIYRPAAPLVVGLLAVAAGLLMEFGVARRRAPGGGAS